MIISDPAGARWEPAIQERQSGIDTLHKSFLNTVNHTLSETVGEMKQFGFLRSRDLPSTHKPLWSPPAQ